MTYRAPINDMLLALNHGAGLQAAIQAGHYGDFDSDIAAAVLEEAGREYQRDRGRALIERALAEGVARKARGPAAASGRKGLLGTLRGVLGALGSGKRQGPDPS